MLLHWSTSSHVAACFLVFLKNSDRCSLNRPMSIFTKHRSTRTVITNYKLSSYAGSQSNQTINTIEQSPCRRKLNPPLKGKKKWRCRGCYKGNIFLLRNAIRKKSIKHWQHTTQMNSLGRSWQPGKSCCNTKRILS